MNDSLIKDIGRSYIVSSLLPASFFFLLAVFIFRDFLPPIADIVAQSSNTAQASTALIQPTTIPGIAPQVSPTLSQQNSTPPAPEPTVLVSSSILVLAGMMWVAFMLYSSVDFVVKLFEGYPYPFFIKIPLQYIQYRIQKYRLAKYFEYKKHRDLIQKIGKLPQDEQEKKEAEKVLALGKMDELETSAKEQVLEHEISAPLMDNWKYFLPTDLGNILMASELYPYEKYGLNGVMLFPRMAMTFPPEFVTTFDEKMNQMMFILNSSFLSYAIGILALILGGIQQIDFSRWPMFFSEIYAAYLARGYQNVSNNHYLVIGALFIIVGYIVYRISINTVKEYAMLVRTSFDLYRFDVLRELNHPIPTTLGKERINWKTVSDFLIMGDRFAKNEFKYKLKRETNGGQKQRG